jgi:tRNA(Ile)-lysidine synthase
VVRPLIDCTRDEVEEHIRVHALPVVRDPSNQDRRFERVRIRMDLLPHLEREDPAIARHLAQLADDARAAWRLVRGEARRLGQEAGDPPRVEVLAGAGESVRREALARWARGAIGRRPGRAQLEALDRAVLEGRGEVLAGSGWVLAVGEGGALCAYQDRARVTRSQGGGPNH